MNIRLVLTFLDILVMVLIVVAVALQNKSSGLSNVFGGAGNIVQTRRGMDKWLFFGTIILGIIFLAINLSFLFIK